jgi:hypothetical protein
MLSIVLGTLLDDLTGRSCKTQFCGRAMAKPQTAIDSLPPQRENEIRNYLRLFSSGAATSHTPTRLTVSHA